MTYYVPPNKVVFSRDQIIFLIENLETLREGVYPTNPDGSDYMDPQIKSQRRAKAPFENPVSLLIEITRRLELSGLDGLLVLCYHSVRMSEESLARYYNIPVHVVRIRINQCLDRIAGWNFPHYRRDNKRRN